MQSSKGKHTERVCNRYTKGKQVPTERKPEHIEIISYARFRRAHADSHAAVVAQLSMPSPPKLSLAAAFACVEISPSIVVAIQPHKKTLYLGEQRVKAGQQPCRMFMLDLPVHGHGGFWQRKGLVLMGGTAPKGRDIDGNSLLGSLPLPWTTKWRSVLHPGGNCPFFGRDHCWTRKTVLKITPLCAPSSLGLPPQTMCPCCLETQTVGYEGAVTATPYDSGYFHDWGLEEPGITQIFRLWAQRSLPMATEGSCTQTQLML